MKPFLIVIMTAGLVASCSKPSDDRVQSQSVPVQSEQPAATQAEMPPPPSPSASAVDAPVAPPAAPPARSQPAPVAARPAPPPRMAAAPAPPAPAVATPPVPAPEPVRQAVAPPPPPPQPQFQDVTVPAGTALSVTVLSTLGSTTSTVEDQVAGAIATPVIVSGLTALPKGSELRGTVTKVEQSGRVKGKALISFRFERLTVRGDAHKIQTAQVTQEAASTKREDVKKGGLGAGLGAVVGGIAGGGTGAAIGAVAGGAATVLGTKGDEVAIAPGTVVTVLLQEAVTVRVPLR